MIESGFVIVPASRITVSAVPSEPFVPIAVSTLAWATLVPLSGQPAWKAGTQKVVADAGLTQSNATADAAMPSQATRLIYRS